MWPSVVNGVMKHVAQLSIPCAIMRGGSSKALFFLVSDLPPPGAQRDTVLKRAMGTPDPLQMDGLGGSRLLTSKIAIIGPATLAGADVDYTFVQVGVDSDVIDYEANCGNISAAVGPFVIDAGWVPAMSPITTVRIHNTNTGKIILARVPVHDGCACVEGDLEVPGVPGTGAEIELDFSLTVGTKSGSLLPTGRVTDVIRLREGKEIEVTLCDVANPVVFVQAASLGLRGTELPSQLSRNTALVATAREIRQCAAVRFGFAHSLDAADIVSPLLPTLMIVSSAATHDVEHGKRIEKEEADVVARFFFLDAFHEAMSGTGALCLAACSHVIGSVVERCVSEAVRRSGRVRVAHPRGVMEIRAKSQASDGGGPIHFSTLAFFRTARKLMEGKAFVPAPVGRNTQPQRNLGVRELGTGADKGGAKP